MIGSQTLFSLIALSKTCNFSKIDIGSLIFRSEGSICTRMMRVSTEQNDKIRILSRIFHVIKDTYVGTAFIQLPAVKNWVV